MQSEGGAWNGIIFDGPDAGTSLAGGDEITITGTVDEADPAIPGNYEWGNNTKLIDVSIPTINNSGLSVLPVVVSTGDLAQEAVEVESYEGCLVTIMNVTVDTLNQYDWSVVDNSGLECLIDNDWADIEADNALGELGVGSTIGSVTGIFNYSFGSYKIQIRDIDDITDVQLEIEKEFFSQPYTFALYSNYPNPFNPVTKFQFEVGAKTEVKLIIYDLLGRPVRSLVQRQYNPGRHIVNWNGRNDFGSLVSSGVYIYRFRAGDIYSGADQRSKIISSVPVYYMSTWIVLSLNQGSHWTAE
jgi:hypothetical protein